MQQKYLASILPAPRGTECRAGSSPAVRLRTLAFGLVTVTLGACMPYGPPIPGSQAAAPVQTASGAAPLADTTASTSIIDSASASSTGSTGSAAPSRSPLETPERFRSRKDSLAWVAARRRAKTDKGLRVLVSLDARKLWVIKGRDTLRTAPVAIGTEKRLVHGKESWVFETPRGVRRVRGKAADPIWTPPKWHYVEMAQRYGLTLAVIPPTGRVALPNGDRLEVRDSLVGRWTRGRGWRALPVDDEIVVDGTLYMPPIGTKNRIQHGQLGPYKLDVGEGYLIHGSPDQSSIGRAVTHGCIRLADDDLTFVFDEVPVGTPVYIL